MLEKVESSKKDNIMKDLQQNHLLKALFFFRNSKVNKNMKFYDISLQLDESLVIYPGDMTVKLQQLKNVEKDQWNLTGLSLSTHSGTHVDTDLHISASGKPVSEIELERCYGKALVVDLNDTSLGESISVQQLKSQLPSPQNCKNLIILFKTGNSKVGYKSFHEDWVDLSSEGAEYLNRCQIKAVGIDSLTIGSYETHRALLLHRILVYEGLDLSAVEPGEYLFVGFPLKIKAEGGMVRAVLIQE